MLAVSPIGINRNQYDIYAENAAGYRSTTPSAMEVFVDQDRMFALAQALAEAKSRQDVAAASRLLHADMLLQTPAFGTNARGVAENVKVLERFFLNFPDYEVELQGRASNAESLVCWGRVRMTMTGERFGATPNGKRADLPVFIRFTFADDLIASEYFFFDLSELCAQSGVSTDAVRRKLPLAAQLPHAVETNR